MTIEEKKIELEKIAREIREFTGLEIAKNCTNSVPGEGSPDTQILCIGEGPGHHEDQRGRPFVGVSGQLLRRTLSEIGISPESVFITNIIKFRPPDNRDPDPSEIEACRDWLDRQIQIIEPKIIVTLGRFSMGKFLENVTISRVHGLPRQITFLDKTYILFPMFHPAAALRGTSMMNEFKNDFVKLKEFLETVNQPVAIETNIEDNISQLGLF